MIYVKNGCAAHIFVKTVTISGFLDEFWKNWYFIKKYMLRYSLFILNILFEIEKKMSLHPCIIKVLISKSLESLDRFLALFFRSVTELLFWISLIY